MPRYKLKCKECGSETITFVPMDERNKQKCSCGALYAVAPMMVGFIVPDGESPNRVGNTDD
jgi:hypothetical protein